jgi:hypothetical protein
LQGGGCPGQRAAALTLQATGRRNACYIHSLSFAYFLRAHLDEGCPQACLPACPALLTGERALERAGERALERAGERALERAGERALERAGEQTSLAEACGCVKSCVIVSVCSWHLHVLVLDSSFTLSSLT